MERVPESGAVASSDPCTAEPWTADAPLVSIGMPIYNGAHFLRAAIDSLRAQDYPNLELILSDDASTDDSPAICREYAAADARIAYAPSATNLRCAGNFNRVLGLARGEFFMWAAQDDLWHPEYVSRCAVALRTRPDAVLCYAWQQPINEAGGAAGAPYAMENDRAGLRDRWRHGLASWSAQHAIYSLMRRSVMLQARPFQACLSSDLIFVMEMALRGPLLAIPEVLMGKRVPAAAGRYASYEGMLDYLGSARRKPPPLLRLQVFRECVRGLRHANLEPRVERDLARDARRIYLTRGFLRDDLHEWAASRGRWRIAWAARLKRAFRGRSSSESAA